jgi:hypothetical protein
MGKWNDYFNADCGIATLLDVDLAIVPREVFERLAASDDLQIGSGQVFLLML